MTPFQDTDTLVYSYIPIGDSLSVGHGARAGESWPAVLTRNLKAEGIDISMPLNPSHSGWTSFRALNEEVPAFEKQSPNFASLLIGANDMAKGVDLAVFTRNFIQILDRMQKKLPDPQNLLVLNLPDFTATPAAQKYKGHLHLEPYLLSFNKVIEGEAASRNLPLIDLYTLTQRLGPNSSYYSWDGLHPSGLGYAEWEKEIRPVARQMLQQ